MHFYKIIVINKLLNKQANNLLITIINSNSTIIIITLRKRLCIRSVISVNYQYIIVLCTFNLLIRFKCYTTV